MIITALLLFATVLPDGARPASGAEVVLEVETLEASSIDELEAGQVVDRSVVSIPNGEHFLYEFEDPRDGHRMQIDLRLWIEDGEAPVRAALSIEDLTADELKVQERRLGIDGELTLTLYPLANERGSRFLRLTPSAVDPAP